MRKLLLGLLYLLSSTQSLSFAKTYSSVFDGRVCLRCHDLDQLATGPSFKMIAHQYENDPKALERLTQVVLNGSVGRWSDEVPMPPISDISEQEARELVTWILKEAPAARRDAMAPFYQRKIFYLGLFVIVLIILLVTGLVFYRRRKKQKKSDFLS